MHFFLSVYHSTLPRRIYLYILYYYLPVNHSLPVIILDIDECTSSPCSINSTCNNTVGSYSCICKNGFIGNGTHCTGMKGPIVYDNRQILSLSQYYISFN